MERELKRSWINGRGLMKIELRRPTMSLGSETELACVTSAASFLGLAIIDRLLTRGLSVRALVHSHLELKRLVEMDLMVEKVIVMDAMDVESLRLAFEGCNVVFHTSAFVDPQAISGYTKHMVEIEAEVAKNVVEACSRTTSLIRKCIFTSSLLACVWEKDPSLGINTITNCWSDEKLCIEKELWLALGKTRAEKAARRQAEDNNVQLVTICCGLIVGVNSNTSKSIAYLKGGSEMYERGKLATVEIGKAVEAHMLAYDDSSQLPNKRYACFDRIVDGREEGVELLKKLGLHNYKILNLVN